MMIRNINKRGNYHTYKFVKNDEKYDSFKFSKFINYIMKKGKKDLAKKLFYNTLDLIEHEDKIQFIDEVINNLAINYDIRKYKAGGTTYSIPFPNTHERDFSVCARLLIDTSRTIVKKRGIDFVSAFKEELNNAYKKTGESYKIMQQRLTLVKQNISLMNMFKRYKFNKNTKVKNNNAK